MNSMESTGGSISSTRSDEVPRAIASVKEPRLPRGSTARNEGPEPEDLRAIFAVVKMGVEIVAVGTARQFGFTISK